MGEEGGLLEGLNVDAYLSGGMIICAIMTIIWLFRFKKKGNRAFIMASAFVVLGGLFYLVKIAASNSLLIAGAMMLVILLGWDAMLRIKEQEANRKP